MSEWISVKDRLPEPDKDVLLCSGLGNFRMAVGGKYELDGGIAHREKTKGETQHEKLRTCGDCADLVKAQTLWHLERLAYLDGCGDVGPHGRQADPGQGAGPPPVCRRAMGGPPCGPS